MQPEPLHFGLRKQCDRKVSTNGTITTVAGNGAPGYLGDGGAATSAELSFPESVALDAVGNLYIADTVNQTIRKVSVTGIISTVAGGGISGYAGDGAPAPSAELLYPKGVASGATSDVYVADWDNSVIRLLTPPRSDPRPESKPKRFP